jgi:hypothetical protein
MSVVDNMRVSPQKREVGEKIDSLPTDEQYDKNPQELELINSIFLPKEPALFGMSKELRAALFAGIVYVILTTPYIYQYIERCTSNKTILNLIVISIVVISTYLFNRFY